ncbi:probable tRNA N6-adenosine threonylcarbamoyltransferase, mitochondrial isoform X2 [Pteropus alecto]|uniref:probable tRNA N6-adenosine threonylcarbamoyltransferase, mitochondrial isoform X2 n=1 Tax=Pteropus alecto TaxID=9402 RepID=UPI000D53AD31|nr:probable tRNA N6-adenosine threonylcarbamoyltransferase, mitochondrial isoform X2 [Pteropus alecto]XP_024895067.1 probable tRNA N6-adenosine threonylcarbamoyltransferase, mitochondrial isoform X2 [Pteropus alecto]
MYKTCIEVDSLSLHRHKLKKLCIGLTSQSDHPLLVLRGTKNKITNSEHWIPKLYFRIASCLLSCCDLKCRVFKNKLIFTKLSSCFCGIIPPVAQQLHRENIQRIVREALSLSKVSPSELSAIATTIKPGLALSLGVGLSFSLQLVNQFKKPFIPIHHMEAHALTIRLTNKVEFPFLVLLISGGHCLLALVRGVSDFLLLGKSLDIAPGDMLDKVARRLSLIKHPECSTMSGGKAIEHLAKQGNKLHFDFKPPMQRAKNCDFSFSGLQHVIDKTIMQKEIEEGIEKGQILSSAADIAAAVQHTIACHIAKRTHRAILFCKQRNLLSQSNAVLVVSGGVASNLYIRKALEIITDATQCTLLCPPPRLCTDNGIMVAWNGVERLHAGLGILYDTEGIRYEPKCPLGVDISKEVGEAAIRVPRLKMKI